MVPSWPPTPGQVVVFADVNVVVPSLLLVPSEEFPGVVMIEETRTLVQALR